MTIPTRVLFLFVLFAVFMLADCSIKKSSHNSGKKGQSKGGSHGHGSGRSGNSCGDIPFEAAKKSIKLKHSTKSLGKVNLSIKKGNLKVNFKLASHCDKVHKASINLSDKKSKSSGRSKCSSSEIKFKCGLERFKISDCCTDTFFISISALIRCGKRIKKVSVTDKLPVTINCPTCQKCSSKKNKCVAVEDGISPSDCDGKGCDGNIPFTEKCQGGSCTKVKEDKCKTCQECEKETGNCINSEDGSTPDDCKGSKCNGENPVTSSCQAGECKEMEDENGCPPCQKCDSSSGTCEFLQASKTQDICSCGQICDETAEGCAPNSNADCDASANEVCVSGQTDSEDTCVTGTNCNVNSDCDAGDLCIDGLCESEADCGQRKEAICDAEFEKLAGDDNRGKCCPAKSQCVKSTLNGNQAVCSTQCGTKCSGTEETGGNIIPIVYCKFGDSPSSVETVCGA